VRSEDRPQLAAGDLRGFGVAVSAPADDQVLPELALGVRAVDDYELGVDHLATAVLAAFEQPAFAGSAGADRELHRRNGVGRYEFGTPLFGGIGVVKSHG
jgi:hypothetical protein